VQIAQETFPKSIRITGRYPDGLWPIEGDRTQLHQVVLNLSVNARDAMPNGGTLELSLENFVVDEHYASMTPGAKPGPHILLRATDTGTGIPRDVLDKIFDPFFTTKEPGKGTGLGLSTVLGIVKSHCGFLSVSSEPGGGTTFNIFLPAAANASAAATAAPKKDRLTGNGELILVVDDEPSIAMVTKLMLENQNYRVLTASDGPEALALFAQHMDTVDVVITDMMMPFMDGVALIRALQRMSSRVHFIASSGHGDQSRNSELKTLEVTASLTKPYDVTQLLRTLRQLLAPPHAA
jgi:CheY-like chemotaxis protein